MPFHRILLTISLLLYSYVFVPSVWSQQLDNSAGSKPAPEILGAMIPENQQIIMNALAEFAAQYKTSPNAVQKFFLRQKRQKFLREKLKNFVVNEWIGRIQTLRTTENGKAYLVLELAIIPPEDTFENQVIPEFKVTMGTWNNAYTDLDYNTLILPGTPLHTWLANFNEGEWLVFSGSSFPGDEDYLKETSPTESEAMLSPQFILKFEFLDKIDFPESELIITESPATPELPVKIEVLKSQYLPV